MTYSIQMPTAPSGADTARKSAQQTTADYAKGPAAAGLGLLDTFFGGLGTKATKQAIADSGERAANNYSAADAAGAGGGNGATFRTVDRWGGVETVPAYFAGQVSNPNDVANRLGIAGRMMDANRMGPSTAAGAQAAGTQLDPTQQAQIRNQQLSLGQSLADQANGIGPSVAGSQLQQSTEMNLQAALAQAASQRGGNLGAAQYALGNARAGIQQQAAMGLAQARIQEQMAARSQLGQVLDSGRGMDIGIASNNAQLGQNNNQFNAGMLQGNNQFNAQQTQGMDQFKSQTLDKLLGMGLTYDQAQQQMQIQQNQFNAQLGAQQAMGYAGINQGGGAAVQQLIGAGIGAGGALAGQAMSAFGGGGGGGYMGAGNGVNSGAQSFGGAGGPMAVQVRG